MTEPDLAVLGALPTDAEHLETARSSSERRLVEDAQRDICEAHPWLPAESVRVVVECLWAAYDDARVRDFIPLLVRKQAREELRDMHAETIELTTTGAGSPAGDESPARREADNR